MSTQSDPKVLSDWKKSYLDLLIDELQPFGNTLQIGFYSEDVANKIQSHKPTAHTIIEADPELAKMAALWGGKHKNVKVIHGSWQTKLPQLGVFDAIFFNDYPIVSEAEFVRLLSEKEALATSTEAKKLLEGLEEWVSQIKVQFSDEEIEKFYQSMGQSNLKALPQFFTNLKNRGNITQKQYENVIKKFQVQEPQIAKPDPMLTFLGECLKSHMKKGSRFSSYLLDSKSKFEDSLFFDEIITNPDLDYSENLTTVKTTNGKQIKRSYWLLKKYNVFFQILRVFGSVDR